MNIGQILGGIVIVAGVLVGASGQLTDLGLSPHAVKAIIAGAGLVTAICGGFITKLQSNYSQTVTTSNIPGVKVQVNEDEAPSAIIEAAKDASIKNVTVATPASFGKRK